MILPARRRQQSTFKPQYRGLIGVQRKTAAGGPIQPIASAAHAWIHPVAATRVCHKPTHAISHPPAVPPAAVNPTRHATSYRHRLRTLDFCILATQPPGRARR